MGFSLNNRNLLLSLTLFLMAQNVLGNDIWGCGTYPSSKPSIYMGSNEGKYFVEVFDKSFHASHDRKGLTLRWDWPLFGPNAMNYALVLDVDGKASYFDFSIERKTKASDVYFCKKVYDTPLIAKERLVKKLAEEKRKKEEEEERQRKLLAEKKIKEEQERQKKLKAEKLRKIRAAAKEKARQEQLEREKAAARKARIEKTKKEAQLARENLNSIETTFSNMVRESIVRQWLKPGGSHKNYFKIKVTPTSSGHIFLKDEIESSGDKKFENSVLKAIIYARPISKPSWVVNNRELTEKWNSYLNSDFTLLFKD